MLKYEECKEIALKKAKACGVMIKSAYKIGMDYVFDSSPESIGKFPVVINIRDGKTYGLWRYLNAFKQSMDNMKEINIENGEKYE